MRVPDGWRVNTRYAARSACPVCGSMLVKLETPVRVVSRGPRIAADDSEVESWEGDGYQAKAVSKGWRHVATMRCPRCGRLLSPAQAVRRDFRDCELPADFLIRDVPDTPETRALMFAKLSASLGGAARARRVEALERAREERIGAVPPGQGELPLDGAEGR